MNAFSFIEYCIQVFISITLKHPQDIEIMDWCPTGPVSSHRKKVPL